MDHWLGVVTCTLINTAPSLSSPLTCCFCRPGLCFRATAFSSFFHASDLQMNFKQPVHGETLLSSCSQVCALFQTCLPSTQETSSWYLSVSEIFYFFFRVFFFLHEIQWPWVGASIPFWPLGDKFIHWKVVERCQEAWPGRVGELVPKLQSLLQCLT